jgi:hypothetical protein
MKEIILNVLKKMRTDYGNNEMIIFAQDSDLQVVADELEVAINYTRCCAELKDKEAPTLKDAFIAGYKKRALMSGLKYDEVSELNAITNFKCWKSFDLNL